MGIIVKDNVSPWIILGRLKIQMTLEGEALCKSGWAQGSGPAAGE